MGDLMGKALWKLVENAQRFPRRGGRVLCVHGPVSFHTSCRPSDRHKRRCWPFGKLGLTSSGSHTRATRATDAALRQAVGVASNKQLAGILSGLSKQAAACHLSAREVFTIENESKAGETSKTYAIARHFRAMATANNWPLDDTPGPEPRERSS